MLHYIPFGTTRNISLRFAREPVFKVCARGATNAKVEEWSKRAVLTWLKAARKIDNKVTNRVEISCDNSHLNIDMKPGNSVSFAGPGRATFFTGKPYGELLHELGHALAGLGDTYVGRQAGNCRQGHPQSNMCWGAYGPRANPEKFSGLWADDIEGVQKQIRAIFSDATPPSNAGLLDPEVPLDANNPWPLEGGVQSNSSGNYVFLEEAQRGQARLFLSVPAGTQEAFICTAAANAEVCASDPARVTLEPAGKTGDRLLFSGEIVIEAEKSYYTFARDGSGSVVAQQPVRFIPKS